MFLVSCMLINYYLKTKLQDNTVISVKFHLGALIYNSGMFGMFWMLLLLPIISLLLSAFILPKCCFTLQRRKKFSSGLLGTLAGSENQTDRDRWTGEKHTNLLNKSFTSHGSLYEEMKTKRNGSTWVFLCWVWWRVESLVEKWEVYEYGVNVVSWGWTAWCVCLDSSQSRLVFGEKGYCFCLGTGEGTSHVRVLWPVSREKGVGRSDRPSCCCCFLKLLQLNIFSMARCHIWG